MEKTVIRPYVRNFIMSYLYMIHKDHVFVANVVVTNMTWETMATSVINRPTGVAVKLNTIVKIHK